MSLCDLSDQIGLMLVNVMDVEIREFSGVSLTVTHREKHRRLPNDLYPDKRVVVRRFTFCHFATRNADYTEFIRQSQNNDLLWPSFTNHACLSV